MVEPKGIYKLLGGIWAVWLAIHFLLFFLLLYPLFWFFLSHPKRYLWGHRLRAWWGRYILTLALIRWQVTFEAPLEKGKTYIFAPNHSSYLDIPSIAVMLPGYLIFMAKAELAKVPLFNIFFKSIDIPVERKSAVKAHRAFMEAAERIKLGSSICMFPEGTIPAHAPELGKFKDGPFRLAIENEVAVVPITLADNHKRMPDKGGFYVFPGKMRMYVHRPISVNGLNLEDASELKQKVYRIIESKLAEYARE
ncbi:MAG: 1-acyl-sn-glycerol-3-phosphate acyltransferase [Bacteroidota bacterium]|nr:1-acyl-sn-glycerol-3-phosphate acyltransferase [Bacteroidota bacterium]MDX5431114.1 1-acyl-sn-glycerol-3-phosphate acyltransferase [Bacteroidota bacterium]MDX5469865.1 1-acyl-sn-glycerol-3-phosphate acyltransferase [Bacteroidota bacterium]